MRLDGVEIKVNLAVGPLVHGGVDTAAVVNVDKDLEKITKTLMLRDPRHWWVWFYEEPATDQTAVPLLEEGIIIRVRARMDDDGLDKAECTVKLPAVRPDQLTEHWAEAESTDDLDYSIEEDWSDDRHVLAVSAKVELSSRLATWLATAPHRTRT